MQSVKGVQMFCLDQPCGFFSLFVIYRSVICFQCFLSVLKLLDLNDAISFKLE